MSKCILGIEQSCDECRICQQGRENLMYYDESTKAIQTHIEESQQRIRVIEDFMKTNPTADEKEHKENIFVLSETNKALGFVAALKPHILNKAVDTYGAAAQTDMAIEEMSELTKALLKFRRAENNPEEYDIERKRLDIYEEIADVMIMLAQLIMIYDGGFCEEELCEIIGDKVKRLEERLNKKNEVKDA